MVKVCDKDDDFGLYICIAKDASSLPRNVIENKIFKKYRIQKNNFQEDLIINCKFIYYIVILPSLLYLLLMFVVRRLLFPSQFLLLSSMPTFFLLLKLPIELTYH